MLRNFLSEDQAEPDLPTLSDRVAKTSVGEGKSISGEKAVMKLAQIGDIVLEASIFLQEDSKDSPSPKEINKLC